ncbi:transglycosylase domain-containing protein [Oceanobacillus rekensis]|uniref:transglycosylase domain-containing protein n=1 Tax=Oceanobacillus rekensis TaxID=937927 RepID=UPI000B44D6C6|nr:transglycosylase domain-containing protein [Oceanobacillus rekensis]
MRLWPKKLIYKIILSLVATGILSFAVIYLAAFLMGPPKLVGEQATIIYDQQGEIIGEERGTHTKHWLSLDEIPPIVADAAIAIEDQHFFDHHGFDYKRIGAAVLENITSASLKEGASTLTQQYARNLFLSPEKTWTRKMKEAFYTVRLEMFYSKEEILEGYLNTIYYGHGAYGIESASNYFFNKSVTDLSLAEVAMLTGIPKGPTYYSPLNDEDNAKERQQLILQNLVQKKIISKKEQTAALQVELTYSVTQESPEIAPFFQDVVLQEASSLLKLDPSDIKTGGYQIHTTLNRNLQQQLEDKTSETINDKSEIETAAISMDPHTGAVLAMVGGRDYRQSTYNRAIDAKRMPGSTFKPFLYYAALHHGYTASTQLMSKPTTFEMENGEVYQPSNFNGYYANEPITLAQALALSDNIYAVKTNMYLGTEKLTKTAEQFGLNGDFPAVPSLALGTASVSVEAMTAAYGMLANGGKEVDTYTIGKITDRHGKDVYERERDRSEQILDPKKTFILTHLMTGMFDKELNGYTSVTGSRIASKLTKLYAGKSGSTNSDSWMIGYSPSNVTGVWTGYDDNRNMEVVSESAYAKEIWATFMEAAHAGEPQDVFAMPSGIVGIPIDPATGKIATPDCGNSRVMYYEKGTEPRSYCTDHNTLEKDMEYIEDTEEKGVFERWFDAFF